MSYSVCHIFFQLKRYRDNSNGGHFRFQHPKRYQSINFDTKKVVPFLGGRFALFMNKFINSEKKKHSENTVTAQTLMTFSFVMSY